MKIQNRNRTLAHALADYWAETKPGEIERFRLVRRLTLSLSPGDYREFVERCDVTLRLDFPFQGLVVTEWSLNQ